MQVDQLLFLFPTIQGDWVFAKIPHGANACSASGSTIIFVSNNTRRLGLCKNTTRGQRLLIQVVLPLPQHLIPLLDQGPRTFDDTRNQTGTEGEDATANREIEAISATKLPDAFEPLDPLIKVVSLEPALEKFRGWLIDQTSSRIGAASFNLDEQIDPHFTTPPTIIACSIFLGGQLPGVDRLNTRLPLVCGASIPAFSGRGGGHIPRPNSQQGKGSHY